MLEELFQPLNLGDADPAQVALNLGLALVLSLVTSFVYRRTHTGFSYSRAFNTTMVGVTMTITMIMMVIGNYLALSLGLVGALSVIRFRTAIKDPKDIAYLFLCIAIGLACAVNNYAISILGTLIINGTLLVLHAVRFGHGTRSDYCLTFRLDRSKNSAETLLERAKERGIGITFRSFAQVSETEGEYVYSLKLGARTEEEVVHFFSTDTPGATNVSLIGPETSLEV